MLTTGETRIFLTIAYNNLSSSFLTILTSALGYRVKANQ
uniref:Uncharacterized protein n=1 Tax=Arundo donax TaxID=35708 RepID=A0A0A9FIZ0_ARUDO